MCALICPSQSSNVVLTRVLPRHTLCRAAFRLLASPAPIVRSRLTPVPRNHIPVVVRRSLLQSRRSAGEAKGALDPKSTSATSTATNTDTTTTTTTTDNALDSSSPVEIGAESNAVEKEVVKGDLKNVSESGTDTTSSASTSSVSTEAAKQDNGEADRKPNSTGSDSTNGCGTNDVPTAPEIEVAVTKVPDERRPESITTDTASPAVTGGAPLEPLNEARPEKPQMIEKRAAVKEILSRLSTKTTTPEEHDPDLDFDISQIREAAAEEAWAAAGKKQMTHGEKLEMLRRLQYEPKQTVFIGNLFYDVTAEDLKKQMAKYGVVEGVNIIYDSRGISKG
ncbi:hypothetical protein BDW66DRAFT_28788 [Aspergillus desertorum]